YVLQDATVTVVVSFTWGVDAQNCVELGNLAVFSGCGDLQGLRGGAVVQLGHAGNCEGFGTGQTQRISGLAFRELQWQNAHADQVRTVDTLERLGDDSLDAQQCGALGSPVTRGARTVFLAAQNDQRGAGSLVVLRSVVDVSLRSTFLGEVAGEATLDAVQQLVLDADVREGTADHDFVVTTARAVGVEVLAIHTVLDQVAASRGFRLERTCRRDVVGGDRIAQLQQYASAVDVLNWLWLCGHAVEVRC